MTKVITNNIAERDGDPLYYHPRKLEELKKKERESKKSLPWFFNSFKNSAFSQSSEKDIVVVIDEHPMRALMFKG